MNQKLNLNVNKIELSMSKINIFNNNDLDLLLSCLKVEKWNENAGVSFHGHQNLIVKSKYKQYIFESSNHDTPLIMPSKTLLKCIDTFMEVIWQEMKSSHKTSNSSDN